MPGVSIHRMHFREFYKTLLISIIILGFCFFSIAITLVPSFLTISNVGRISSQCDVYAVSGSASDIQEAVNLVIDAGGIGNVLLPEGTYNFYESDEPWTTVQIPAGVNIIGAATERDSNDQVLEWKTVLVMPFEATDRSVWFEVNGNNDPNETTRITDLKLVGYRFYNNTSTTMYTGINLNRLINFRVDHCHFQDICGSALWIGGQPMRDYNDDTGSGLVDHCRFENTVGHPGVPNYGDLTLGYGIGMRRVACDIWEPNIEDVYGHYHNYTIFIEHNYFSKWRHCTCSNDGFHYVFRYNTVENSYGTGDVDTHGSYATETYQYMVGTRAVEIYNNTFKDPDTTYYATPLATQVRGGGALIYNNTLINYHALTYMRGDKGVIYVPFTAVNDTYIWNNDLGGAGWHLFGLPSPGIDEGEEYYLRAPNLAQDGWEYTPYPSPHPLESP